MIRDAQDYLIDRRARERNPPAVAASERLALLRNRLNQAARREPHAVLGVLAFWLGPQETVFDGRDE